MVLVSKGGAQPGAILPWAHLVVRTGAGAGATAMWWVEAGDAANFLVASMVGTVSQQC
jgi:hypothetical protein